jgi:hypothetical protein
MYITLSALAVEQLAKTSCTAMGSVPPHLPAQCSRAYDGLQCVQVCTSMRQRMRGAPAPVTMVWPSGDTARYSTRIECPVSVASLDSPGHRHTHTCSQGAL